MNSLIFGLMTLMGSTPQALPMQPVQYYHEESRCDWRCQEHRREREREEHERWERRRHEERRQDFPPPHHY